MLWWLLIWLSFPPLHRRNNKCKAGLFILNSIIHLKLNTSSYGYYILLEHLFIPSTTKWDIVTLPSAWKSIGFQTLLRTKYVPSLVKIHWRMLILECSQGCYTVNNLPSDLDLWSMTLKINRVPDSSKDYVCTKFGQNPLKDVDSRVFTRMLRSRSKVKVTGSNF
jgi:hypothetical protein